MIPRIGNGGGTELPQIRRASHLMGTRDKRTRTGEDQGSQNHDDGDHDQQFRQREAMSAAADVHGMGGIHRCLI